MSDDPALPKRAIVALRSPDPDRVEWVVVIDGRTHIIPATLDAVRLLNLQCAELLARWPISMK